MKVVGLVMASVLLLLAGCSGGTDISTDWDPEADFTNLRTYQFADRTPNANDDPRVYNDVTIQRIRSAIDTALRARGYEPAGSGEPDFKVAWYGSIDKKMNMQTVQNNYGYTPGWRSAHDPNQPGSKTYVNEWEEGTLVIDIIDPKKNELMWRGTGTALVEDNVSPGRDQENLNNAVARILQKFPPQK